MLEIEGLVQDAARYRWLRARAHMQEIIDFETGLLSETLEEMDAAIDSAIAKGL